MKQYKNEIQKILDEIIPIQIIYFKLLIDENYKINEMEIISLNMSIGNINRQHYIELYQKRLDKYSELVKYKVELESSNEKLFKKLKKELHKGN